MRSYKGYTEQQRKESLKKTKQAIKDGVIPVASKCNRCGQDQGIIQYHNHDYSDPIKFLEELCWRCHMVHHSIHRAPKQCCKYWEAIAQGKRFDPVFKHDFAILARDHGIK